MRITTFAGLGAGALLVYFADAKSGRERRRRLFLRAREMARPISAALTEATRHEPEITIDLGLGAEVVRGTVGAPSHRGFTRTLRQAYIVERRSAHTPANTR
ncbi:MAG: hypothetical protein WCA93_04335 [Acidimicrobiia bacterium]